MNNNSPLPLPSNLVRIENIELEKFEIAVYTHQFEAAAMLLREALARLRNGASFVNYENTTEVKNVLYTRFAAATLALMADPRFSVSTEGFDILAQHHPTIDLLFRSSAFGSSDHLLPIMSANPMESDRRKLKLPPGPALMKYLLTQSLRSGFAMNFEATFRKAPEQTFALWVGLITSQHNMRVTEFKRHEALLGMADVFADMKLDNAKLLGLSDAFMYCSYGVREDKHDLKRTVMKLFERALHFYRAPMPMPDTLRARHAATAIKMAGDPHYKPRMLIGVEWFNSVHAMYRCWQPVVAQLRTKFHLIGSGRTRDIDEIGKAEFDEWLGLPDENVNLPTLITQINELQPDIIFYPSVGMALWWVALSAVRLAPMQMFGLGHPATTHSAAMDYCLCEEGHAEPDRFREKLLVYPRGGARFKMRVDANLPEVATFRLNPETVHVAVPAMLLKINEPYLRLLAQVTEASERPITFHFMVNMTGINLEQAAADIRFHLPTARIYERTEYGMYLRFMRECDFVICPAPFGGTNSTVDALHLGLPVIAWWGREPHERFDALMLHRANLPDWCVAHGADEFIAAIIKMANDDNARCAVRDAVLNCNVWKTFYTEGDPNPTSVVDVVWAEWRKRCGLSLN